MSKTRITVDINTDLLTALDRYAAEHRLSRDFALALAVDQFLSEPDNHLVREAVES